MGRSWPSDPRSTAEIKRRRRERGGAARLARAGRGRGGAPLPAARSSPELPAQLLRCTKTQAVCSGRERRSRRIHPWPLRGRGSAHAARTTAAPLPTPSVHANKALEATKWSERNIERKRGRRRRSPRQEAGQRWLETPSNARPMVALRRVTELA